MYPNTQITVFILAALVLFGCGKKKMGVADYQHYIGNPENGLKIETERQGMKTEFSVEPLDWQAFKASYADNGVDKEKFAGYKKDNTGLLQCSFKVYLPDGTSLYDYFAGHYENPGEAMLYAEYDMKDDFRLMLPSGDSLHAFATHHQPSFGIKPYEEFLVLFRTADKDIESKELDILYRDNLFGLQNLSYRFGGETMRHIPILNIQ